MPAVYPLSEELNQKFIREAVKSVLDSVCGLYPAVFEGAENAWRAFALQEFLF
jgi:hypothetical protein